MSNKTVNEVRRLPMHKTPKFVLWVLADIADENGYTGQWASSARIIEETGYSNRAVADSIAYLVDCGVLVVDGGKGKSSKYQINPGSFNAQVKYDPKAKAKVVSAAHQLKGNEQDESSERGADEVVSAAPEVVNPAQKVVSAAHTIHLSLLSPFVSTNIYCAKCLVFLDNKFAGGKYIKSKPAKKPKTKILTLEQGCSVPLPANVDSGLWVGYIEMRHAIKKPPTDNAVTLLLEDLAGWGESANESLKNSIKSSWVGLFPVKQQAIAQFPVNQKPAYQSVAERTAAEQKRWSDYLNGSPDERDITPKKSYLISEVGHA